jgi:hypothetical protein
VRAPEPEQAYRFRARELVSAQALELARAQELAHRVQERAQEAA